MQKRWTSVVQRRLVSFGALPGSNPRMLVCLECWNACSRHWLARDLPVPDHIDMYLLGELELGCLECCLTASTSLSTRQLAQPRMWGLRMMMLGDGGQLTDDDDLMTVAGWQDGGMVPGWQDVAG